MARQGVLAGLGAPDNVQAEMAKLMGDTTAIAKALPGVKKEEKQEAPEKPPVEPAEAPKTIDPHKAKEASPEPVQEQEKSKAEVEAEPVQQEDPWIPVKERFKDRDPKEVLTEWEQIQEERESLKARLQLKEDQERELQERLIAYDVANSPEYKANVIDARNNAEQVLVEVCGGDPELAKQFLALKYSKDLDQKSKAQQMRELCAESMVSQVDLLKAFTDREKAIQRGEEYKTNWKVISQQRQEASLKELEDKQKAREESFRSTYRTAANKAETRLKELGIDYLDGFADAKTELYKGVERTIEGSGSDIENDVLAVLLGKMLLKNHKGLKDNLKKLSDFEAASRSTPAAAAKASTAKPKNDTKYTDRLFPA